MPPGTLLSSRNTGSCRGCLCLGVRASWVLGLTFAICSSIVIRLLRAGCPYPSPCCAGQQMRHVQGGSVVLGAGTQAF